MVTNEAYHHELIVRHIAGRSGVLEELNKCLINETYALLVTSCWLLVADRAEWRFM